MLPQGISTNTLASRANICLGAYGLQLRGFGGAGPLLVQARPEWPTLELVRCTGRSDAVEDMLGPDRALVRLLGGGEVVVERSPGRATYTTPRELTDEELIHPYLAPAAALAARWLDRESFHGGAFATERGVWVIAGEKAIGKSSTLAWLAARGTPVVADDVVVLDDERVFVGPRIIDLREESARALELGEPIGVAGERERWRVRLKPVASELPLAGWIFPSWSTGEVEVTPIAPPERLLRIAQSRVLGVVTERPDLLLKLAALPAWEFRRPAGWDGFERAVGRLLNSVGP